MAITILDAKQTLCSTLAFEFQNKDEGGSFLSFLTYR